MARNQYRYDDESPDRIEDDMPAPRRKGGVGGKIACGCIVVIFLIGGCTAAIFGGVFWMLTESDAYVHGLSQAQQHEAVQAALGEPIEAGLLIQGSINLHNDDGTADIYIPISGPNGSASVHVVGTKTDGQWTYRVLTCSLDDSDTVIDLLAAPEPESESEPIE